MDHTLPSNGEDGGLGLEGGSWHPALRPERHPSPQPVRSTVTSHAEQDVAAGGEMQSRVSESGSWHPALQPERDSLPAQDDLIEDQSDRPTPSPLEPVASKSIDSEDEMRQSSEQEISTDSNISGPNASHAPQTSSTPLLVPVEPSGPAPIQDKTLGNSMAEHNTLSNGWGKGDLGDDSFFKVETESQEMSGMHRDEPNTVDVASDAVKSLPAKDNLTNGDHDFSWDEPDSVDPAWGLARTETEVFDRLQSVDRSNSFPEVPPPKQPQAEPPVHLPASQVESIAQDLE